MNRVVSVTLLALSLALSACQIAHAPAAVRMVEPPGDSKQWHFEPALIAIHMGDVVSWTNTGTEAHTVTADDGRHSILRSSIQVKPTSGRSHKLVGIPTTAVSIAG